MEHTLCHGIVESEEETNKIADSKYDLLLWKKWLSGEGYSKKAQFWTPLPPMVK